ncbi:MAG TPA: DUF3347 domain-containing protein, partial [Flavisolibacter sp.]|nr:DUF3347 domain-containing protein [Flavisolibacter sp.]
MRSIITISIILIVFVGFWFYLKNRGTGNSQPKEKPIPESKHSKEFNSSIGTVMENYYALTESLVNWDSSGVKSHAQALKSNLDSFKLDELKKDSAGIEETASAFMNEVKNDADSIRLNNSILLQRQALNNMTQNLYDFLRSVKYDRAKLYLEQCAMAFNETEPGVWLSKGASIRN